MLNVWFEFERRSVNLGLLLALLTIPLSFAAAGDSSATSVSCATESTRLKMACDYRHSIELDVKDVSLKVGGQSVQIPQKGVTNYPFSGQSTALLFLIDVSDPKRKNTIEKKKIPAVTAMLANQKAHQRVGLAVFDREIRVLAPIGSNESDMRGAISNVKAIGKATEFYKNILSAIALLKKTEASRKGLIVMSDGRDEDRAYKHDDVIKAAKEAGVIILALGYLEKPADSPSLQTLKRLADETYGQYFDATNQPLPPALEQLPFAFVEKGGRVLFDAGAYAGLQDVTITLRSMDGKITDLKTTVEFPDNRTYIQLIVAVSKKFWMPLVAGIAVLMLSIAVAVRYRRRKKEATPRLVEYALLAEMNGFGTQHVLTKTAVCIGRNANNDISLSNDSISSHHAEIHRKRDGDFYIVDLASANGVYVNDKKVTQVELHDGDRIELGEVRFRFTKK